MPDFVCCCVSIVAPQSDIVQCQTLFVAVSVLLHHDIVHEVQCRRLCCYVGIVVPQSVQCSVFVSVSVLYHRVYSIQCLLLCQFCCSTECTKFSVFVAVSVLLQHRVYRPFSVCCCVRIVAAQDVLNFQSQTLFVAVSVSLKHRMYRAFSSRLCLLLCQCRCSTGCAAAVPYLHPPDTNL